MLNFKIIVFLLFSAAFLLAMGNETIFDGVDYFPLDVGYYWNYIDSSAVMLDTNHVSIISETVVSGYTTYVSLYNGMDTSFFQIRPDGIYSIEPDESLVVKLLPSTFAVGDSWVVFTMDTSWDSASMNFTYMLMITGIVKGVEDVDVPAGTFTSCIRVLDSQYVHFTVRDGGIVVYDTMYTNRIINLWCARDVGLVKAIEHELSTGDYEYSYLISYSVSNVEENRVNVPNSNRLVELSPNPFNSSCRIKAPEKSVIMIYNVRGECIDVVRLKRGQAIWCPKDKDESGVYFFRFISPNGIVATRKAVYLK